MRPSQSTRETLKIKSPVLGLSDILKTSLGWDECLVSFEEQGLPFYVLPGGQPSGNSELLLSEKMRKMINQMCVYADYIILDMPPNSMLADTVMLSNIVDTALYVVMSDYASKDIILRGMKELSSYGIDICGCILNGEKQNRPQGYGYANYAAKHFQ